MTKTKLSPAAIIAIALAVVKLMLHFLTKGNYELHRDAFLYLALAEHPDWGYASVPPSIAVFANITDVLFGLSAVAVGFFPALLGAGAILLIYWMVRELDGGAWAVILACSAYLLSPAYLRTGSLFQPVSFNQFYWILTTAVLLKMVKDQNPNYWLALGGIWGLAFLNKYSIVFIATAVVLALLVSKDRKLLLTKQFLWGIAIGGLIASPNLLWQLNNDWPLLTHMAALRDSQLVNVSISGYLIAQLMMNMPALFVWLSGLFFFLFTEAGQRYRSLGLTFLVVIIILLLLRGKPYYTLGAYPLLMVAGGVYIEQLFATRFGWLRPALLTGMASLSLFIIPFSLPLLPMKQMAAYAADMAPYGFEQTLIWEDGKRYPLPQDYADMVGWKEVADIVTNAYHALPPAEQANCSIYAENYGLAGAIMYHTRDMPFPEPISFSDNFRYWAPDSLEVETVIYVNDEVEEISYFFEDIQLAGQLDNPYARENGVGVYLLRGPRNDFAGFYKDLVKRLGGTDSGIVE